MSWTLSRRGSTGQQIVRTPIPARRTLYLIESAGGLLPVPDPIPEHVVVLGHITHGDWGVKLESVKHSLSIRPGRTSSSSPLVDYQINDRTDGRSEIIFLRENDSICVPGASNIFTLVWDIGSEVQVDSSVGAAAEIPESLDPQSEGANATPGQSEETEDEDLDRPTTVVEVTQSIPQASWATPLPSFNKSEVIQETPTADRTKQFIALPKATTEAMDSTPSPGIPALMDGTEVFSTAPVNQKQNGVPNRTIKPESDLEDNHDTREREIGKVAASHMTDVNDSPTTATTGRHPKVQIPPKKSTPLKRPSFTAEKSASKGRPTKRKKTEHDSEHSDISAIGIDTPAPKAPATSKKKRSTTTDPESTSTTVKPQKGSQRSTAEEGLYAGPKPRVAFSNSAIQASSYAMKFLKKHGGASVDSVKVDDCNVLCVKDGTLAKTMKLLQGIALGIPIVTDKWLMDSAKEGNFLSLEPYMPKAATQEKEWNFSMARIWGNKQTELLHGRTIYFTPALKSSYDNFSEIEQVCKSVGARRTISKPGKEVKDSEGTIMLAAEKGDDDAIVLAHNGYTCFSKHLLTNSILRGSIDLESDEFKVNPTASSQPKKKGQARKS
ncbi:hypothetical protein BDV95DRAFT_263294 [Massariosphaeria phaeospora]|uniref:BRCT domain-containing protein n=1 Tax=Massariosphaeria phaeospora TaxID=100035 RepID=A0A7C8M1F5_9PLEO|nr:hypothetical protein BDV95DRAFT_263294 [Massariosphaeria phaeospora]